MKRQLNSIENLISQALIDPEISHEEYKTIINKEENYNEDEKNKMKKRLCGVML